MQPMKPKISTDPMYQLLRERKITEFNVRFERGEKPNLANCDFWNVDLRGVDLSQCNLKGASLHGTRISGTLFPKELNAQEILLSHQQGTRMRYKT